MCQVSQLPPSALQLRRDQVDRARLGVPLKLASNVGNHCAFLGWLNVFPPHFTQKLAIKAQHFFLRPCVVEKWVKYKSTPVPQCSAIELLGVVFGNETMFGSGKQKHTTQTNLIASVLLWKTVTLPALANEVAA